MAKPVVDWTRVDTVLLDMDGTLLDLGFDNHFWQTLIPRRWARLKGLTETQGRERLARLYAERRGTLEWYCIDHWSRELGLRIEQLKHEFAGHVRYLPGAEDFLTALARMGKRRVLITNAHERVLAIKLAQTGLDGHLDAIHSTHAFGLPKEHVALWARLRLAEPFDPARSVLIDDSLAVLKSAKRYGVAQVCAVTRPDPAQAPLDAGELPAVPSVASLLGSAAGG